MTSSPRAPLSGPDRRHGRRDPVTDEVLRRTGTVTDHQAVAAVGVLFPVDERRGATPAMDGTTSA